MSEVLYPDGYGNPPRMVPIETVFARSSVQMLHPEYQKRWHALMVASQGKVGIGGAGRSSEQQLSVFLQRHYVVTSGGCCYYDGKRYQLRAGMAHAAPPNRSFHEKVVQGYSAAVDAVGDLAWAARNCEMYGLEQATWGSEDWHFQFTEYPHSVTQWRALGSPPPQNWKVPGETTALLGPDVSSYDDGLIQPSTPPFLIARASIGLSLDASVGKVIDWARRMSVPFCGYHFVFEQANHPATAQAATFSKAVGGDTQVPCMLDWEIAPTDYCHPGGHEQHATWADVLGVMSAIRKLGHKVGLVYVPNWYWSEQGQPNMAGVGLDMVNAQYGKEPWPTGSPTVIYSARGGDAGPGWLGYGGLTPVLWQYTCQATWGNRTNVDFNAYLGKASDLERWFTTWPAPTTPPELEDDDMLFICKVGTTIYVGDGVRATAVAAEDVDTIKANIEGVNTARWRHPARKDLPILTKMADIPTINAGQRDCLVGKLA